MLRFSPAPTHDMSIGTLRIAIVNYLLAQQAKDSFTIRIEDIDKSRNIEGKDTEIMQILEKFALIHDSVFHQSEHLHMHQTLAIKLLEEKKAFVCLCSEEEIKSDKEKSKSWGVNYTYHGRCIDAPYDVKFLKESKTPFVIRMLQPTEAIIHDDIIQGSVRTAPNDIGSFVILNADGTPTYDFACACDDMLSGVTFIVREVAYLSHMSKQEHIKTQLGYTETTRYAHIPSIIKTQNPHSVQWLFEQGFIPDAIINYLLQLGNTPLEKKIFTLPEAIEYFHLEDIAKSEVAFDIETLRYINREHLKKMEDIQLSSLFGFADAEIGKLVKLYLEEASTINALASKIRPIFAPKVFKGEWREQMTLLQKIIANAPMIHSFDDFIAYLIKKSELQEEDISKPLRLLLTGAENGPNLCDIYPLIKPYLLEVAS